MSLTVALLAMIMQPVLSPGAGIGAQDLGGAVTSTGQVNRAATGRVTFRATGSFDQAPTWAIAEPSAGEVGRMYPARARQRGESGVAVLNCTLTADGVLSGCRVQRETGELDFGAAAAALAQTLIFNPARQGGRPVATPIEILVDWQGPGAPLGSLIAGGGQTTSNLQRVVLNPPWTSAPSYQQVVAAYPAQARQRGLGGAVSIYCTFTAEGTLTRCGVENESAGDLGLGAAALDLARYFRAPPVVNGTPLEGRGVSVLFNFTPRMLEPGVVATGRPVLVGAPSADDIRAALPTNTAGVTTAEVVLGCTVGAGGVPTDCTVAQETPTGRGFARSAMALSSKFRLSVWADGLPTIGGRVNIPVPYQFRAAQAGGAAAR